MSPQFFVSVRGCREPWETSLSVGSEGPLWLLMTRNPSSFAFCASRLVPGAGEEGWQDAVKRLGAGRGTTAVVDLHDLEPFPGEVSEGSVDGTRREAGSGRIRCDGERAEARLRRRQPDVGRGLECAGGWRPRACRPDGSLALRPSRVRRVATTSRSSTRTPGSPPGSSCLWPAWRRFSSRSSSRRSGFARPAIP